MLRPHRINVDVLVPRHRVRILYGRRQQMVRRCRVPIPPSPPDRSRIHTEKLESVSKTQPSSEPVEQVVDGDFRKQFVLSVPQYELVECKYEFKMSSFGTTKLNLLFTEAEKKGKIRNYRMYIGPGSGGSSADKQSLDLKFNPWDTAITVRTEWHAMSETVFTQYDPSET